VRPHRHEDRFRDRAQAGRLLGERLRRLGLVEPVVLGVARGGVEVAAPVAVALGGELDVLVVRKLAQRSRPELGLGALSEDGPVVWDEAGLARLHLGPDDLVDEIAEERSECLRRVLAYRGGRDRRPATGRDVVVVDDGVATGVTALAALLTMQHEGPARLALAAPVVAAATVPVLEGVADDVVVLLAPEQFGAVSRFYGDFGQTSDATVVRLLSGPP
jgi:putative phosphoribosyl transferase